MKSTLTERALSLVAFNLLLLAVAALSRKQLSQEKLPAASRVASAVAEARAQRAVRKAARAVLRAAERIAAEDTAPAVVVTRRSNSKYLEGPLGPSPLTGRTLSETLS